MGLPAPPPIVRSNQPALKKAVRLRQTTENACFTSSTQISYALEVAGFPPVAVSLLLFARYSPGMTSLMIVAEYPTATDSESITDPDFAAPPVSPTLLVTPVAIRDDDDDDDMKEDSDDLDSDAADGDDPNKDALDDDDDVDEFDDIDEDDFDDNFDDDFEEELEDDYEIEIEDEISAEFGLNSVDDELEEELDDSIDDDLDDFEDFEKID